MENKKNFWGYNSQEEAEKYWTKEKLHTGKITTKTIPVVKDGTTFPQQTSRFIEIIRIELKNDIICFENETRSRL